MYKNITYCLLSLFVYLFAGSILPVKAQSNTSKITDGKHFNFLQAFADTSYQDVHPDSIPYSADPTFGRQVLKAPATIFYAAISPLKWGMIYAQEKQVFTRLSNFFLNDAGTAGFYPTFSVGGRTDFAAGITYFNRNLFNVGHSLDLTTFYTNPTNFKWQANYKVPPNEQRRYQVNVNGNIRQNDDQDIFLGGNSGSAENEVDYGIEQYSLQLELGYLIQRNLLASLSGGIDHAVIKNVGTRTDAGTPIEDLENLQSLNVGKPTLANAGISATFDRRNALSENTNSNLVSTVTSSYDFKQTKVRVYSGALFDAGISYNTAVDSPNYDFLNYYGDWQQFFPLPFLPQNRRLAIRTRLEKRYPLGNDIVPFYKQSILGDPDNLRGYEQDRFRDLGSLLVTVEYRWPIWDTWDAVIFTDQGQVFREFGQISFSRFNSSVGTGLRFMTATDFLFRVEVAFSPEDTQGLLEFSMNF